MSEIRARVGMQVGGFGGEKHFSQPQGEHNFCYQQSQMCHIHSVAYFRVLQICGRKPWGRTMKTAVHVLGDRETAFISRLRVCMVGPESGGLTVGVVCAGTLDWTNRVWTNRVWTNA